MTDQTSETLETSPTHTFGCAFTQRGGLCDCGLLDPELFDPRAVADAHLEEDDDA